MLSSTQLFEISGLFLGILVILPLGSYLSEDSVSKIMVCVWIPLPSQRPWFTMLLSLTDKPFEAVRPHLITVAMCKLWVCGMMEISACCTGLEEHKQSDHSLSSPQKGFQRLHWQTVVVVTIKPRSFLPLNGQTHSRKFRLGRVTSRCYRPNLAIKDVITLSLWKQMKCVQCRH